MPVVSTEGTIVSAFDPPTPALQYLARFEVEVAPPQDFGDTPWGRRRIIDITGGRFTGPALRGRVLPGGADWQIVHADGSTAVDTRYSLQTEDGDLIHIRTRGVRCGAKEVIDALGRGEDVDPASYYFRVFVEFETGSAELDWLNRTLAVGAGMRTADAVVYDAHALL